MKKKKERNIKQFVFFSTKNLEIQIKKKKIKQKFTKLKKLEAPSFLTCKNGRGGEVLFDTNKQQG
jgi:hypothetical protein